MAKKSFHASHIELRHKTYFAVLYVPKDVRHLIGKSKFTRSTATGDQKLAERRAAAFVIGWQAQISRARHESVDPIIAQAQDLLNNLKTSGAAYLVPEIVEERYVQLAEESPILAEEFRRIASGKKQVLSGLLVEWAANEKDRGLEQKTIDQMKRDVGKLAKFFPTASTLTPDFTEKWIRNLAEEENLSASSVTRIVGFCRNFFRYLKSIGEVGKDVQIPFEVPAAYKKSKKPNAKQKNKTEHWKAFNAHDVVSLYNQALKKEDIILADLIKIGAYTGARIEEICSQKCSDIHLDDNWLRIVDSKTDAGLRDIPIHSKIKGRMEELIKESKDGCLLSGLKFNKYMDRSNAIGKRFGRLKTKMGYSNLHVFHSVRKAFVTLLENANVPENLAADLIGHEKQTMTYGIYSGGFTIDVMQGAIEKVSYRFD